MNEVSAAKDRIIRLVNDKSITPYRIAKESNVPSSTIYDLKNGKRKFGDIPLDTAIKLIDFCDFLKKI